MIVRRPRFAVAVLVAVAVVASALASCARSRAAGAPPPAPAFDTAPRGVLVTPTGIVVPILSRSDAGHWVRTPCYAMAFVRGGEVVEHADVVIDPGHGGTEPGAVGPTGLTEHEVNMAVSVAAIDHLQRRGYRVIRTQSGRSTMTLHTRGEIAVALRPRAFVSVHHNSGGPPPAKGRPSTETFFQFRSPASRELAQQLYDGVGDALSTYDVAWVRDVNTTGPKFRIGDHGDYYGILRYSAGVPAAIVEVSVISHDDEESLQRTTEYRKRSGAAVAAAIDGYLTSGVDPPPLDPSIPVDTILPPEVPTIPDDSANCTDPPLERAAA